MTTQKPFFIVDLSEDSALIGRKEVAEEHFHYGPKPAIEACKIEISIAEKPFAINYIKLCKNSQIEISKAMEILYERFDIWLIKSSIGIMDKSNACDVIDVGYKTEFTPNVSIQSLLPETKYVKRKVSGGISIDANLGANGEASLEEIKIESKPLDLSLGGEVKLGVKGNFSLNISMPVLTPTITSVGENDYAAEWQLKREDKILAGDQSFTQIILLDKGMDKVQMKAKVYCTVRKFGLVNSRRESDWISIDIPLVG